jgi:hypothetical protein
VADIAAEQRSPRSQNMSYFNERVFLLTRVIKKSLISVHPFIPSD